MNFYDIQVWIQVKTGNGSSYGFSYIFLFQRHRTHFSLYFHSINIKTSILWFSNTTNKKYIVSQVRWIKWIFLLRIWVFSRNIVRSLALAYRPTFLLYRNPMTSKNYYIYSTNSVLCFGIRQIIRKLHQLDIFWRTSFSLFAFIISSYIPSHYITEILPIQRKISNIRYNQS